MDGWIPFTTVQSKKHTLANKQGLFYLLYLWAVIESRTRRCLFVYLSLSSVNLDAWFLASHLPVCSPSALPSKLQSRILSCFTGWCFLLFRRLRNASACQTASAGRRPTIRGDDQKQVSVKPNMPFWFCIFLQHRKEVNIMKTLKRFVASGAHMQSALFSPRPHGELKFLLSSLFMLCSCIST